MNKLISITATLAILSTPTPTNAAQWSLLCGYDIQCNQNMRALGNALGNAGAALERHGQNLDLDHEHSRGNRSIRCQRFGNNQVICNEL